MNNNKKKVEKNNNISTFDQVLRLIDIEIHKKGWTRRDLVKALGKSDAWISYIMNKKRRLSIQTLLDIAEALEIEPASLLPSDENKFSNISLDEYIRQIVKNELDKKEVKEQKDEN